MKPIEYRIAGYCAIHLVRIIELDSIYILAKIKRLSNAHQYQCVNACNGAGYIPRKGYFDTGSADKGAYVPTCPKCGSDDIYFAKSDTPNADCFECGGCHALKPNSELIYEETVFDKEIKIIESKITKLTDSLTEIEGLNFKAKYQHDPRGATVKMFFNNECDITNILYV